MLVCLHGGLKYSLSCQMSVLWRLLSLMFIFSEEVFWIELRRILANIINLKPLLIKALIVPF